MCGCTASVLPEAQYEINNKYVNKETVEDGRMTVKERLKVRYFTMLPGSS